MAVNLGQHQLDAVEKLKSGSILCGGVGSGKSRTAIAYFYLKECDGKIKINGKGDFSPLKKPKDLYIITTAKKRDSLDWDSECAPFSITSNPDSSIQGIKLKVDSWNNIAKYINVKDAFFIFDEQRLVGSGKWVKSFYKIAANNNWILLSATPGDTWSDYIPVFVANGYYKNKTQFEREHVIYSRYSKFPKVDRYVGTKQLHRQQAEILVLMPYERLTKQNHHMIHVDYNKELYKDVMVRRWNPFKDKPIKNISELGYVLRKIVNQDESRIEEVIKLLNKHSKVIIFYNFNYELDMLKELMISLNKPFAEWNGKLHQEIPKTDSWVYLVQYTAGAEGWNCVETDTIIFYSQNYSYKIMIQSAGRIDRLDTMFIDLHYYHLRSTSVIDIAIARSLNLKKDFNMSKFITNFDSRQKHRL